MFIELRVVRLVRLLLKVAGELVAWSRPFCWRFSGTLWYINWLYCLSKGGVEVCQRCSWDSDFKEREKDTSSIQLDTQQRAQPMPFSDAGYGRCGRCGRCGFGWVRCLTWLWLWAEQEEFVNYLWICIPFFLTSPRVFLSQALLSNKKAQKRARRALPCFAHTWLLSSHPGGFVWFLKLGFRIFYNLYWQLQTSHVAHIRSFACTCHDSKS